MSPSATAPITVTVPERTEPGRRRRAGRHLRPVERVRKKRSPAVPVLVGMGIVLAALFGLAAMHALLIGGQLRLDDLRREEAAEAEQVRRLRLEVAELEAPDRVLEVARDRLGMVDAGEVGYLLPVGVDGGADQPVRVAPAEPPPPPTTVPVEDVSPEQAEVQQALGGDEAGDDADGPAATGTGTDTDADADDSTTATTGVDADETSPTPSEGEPDGGQG